MTLPKHDVDAAIKQYDNNAAFRTEVRKLVHNGKKLNDARHKTFITVAQPHVFVSFAPKCSYNSFFAPYELSHHLRQFNRKERDILQRFEMIMAYADPRGSKEPVVRFCTVTERKCPGANPARTAKLVLELYDFIKKRWIISLAEDFIPMETAAYET